MHMRNGLAAPRPTRDPIARLEGAISLPRLRSVRPHVAFVARRGFFWCGCLLQVGRLGFSFVIIDDFGASFVLTSTDPSRKGPLVRTDSPSLVFGLLFVRRHK